MEYVPGGDLMGYVRDGGALPEGEVRAIAEQILQALFVLHEHLLTHRDVKPQVTIWWIHLLVVSYLTAIQNILVLGTSPVRIKMADFGQTKHLDGSYHTPTGTRDWAAPEQRTHNYGPTIDMWGVGCVVYFLLTSLNPFVTGDDESSATIQRHTFPSWPRLTRDKFQEGRNRKTPGDQILVRGVGNAVNDFLNRLIVLDPAGRMPVYQALLHRWIYDIPPLESALQHGDLRLSGLLARYDDRYRCRWAEPLTETTWQVILRFAAANGHHNLVSTALEQLTAGYSFTCNLPGWPDLPPALVGAARSGDCDTINRLMSSTCLATEETSGPSMEQAIWAALVAGKLGVIDTLGYRTVSCIASNTQLSKYIAGYGHPQQLRDAISVYRGHDVPDLLPVQCSVWGDGLMYPCCFPMMLLATARVGNIENLKCLLSDPPSRPLSINHNVFHMAARMGHCDIVHTLLEHYPGGIRYTFKLLQELFHTAAYYGKLVVAELLLEYGVLPSRTDINTAISRNNNAVVQVLLKGLIIDDSPQSIDLAHQCAISAIAHCDVWLLRWLHTRSPNPGLDMRKAARFGNLAVVKYLLHQAPPYRPSPALISAALVGAAEVGNVRIVRYLLTCGIEVGAADPWLVAATNGHVEVLELLLGCGPPERNVLNQAARLAARANHIGVVILVMHHGAKWNGDCDRVVRAVVSAFVSGGQLPEIGAAASRRL